MFKYTLLILLISSVSHSFPAKPIEEITSGDICTVKDRDFEEFRYHENIPYCRRNVSFWRRQKIYDIYGVPESCRDQFTIDHFIPLALGGNNADENLWPEHKKVKNTRPSLEVQLFHALRNGEVIQEEAIEIIVSEKTNPGLKKLRDTIQQYCDFSKN